MRVRYTPRAFADREAIFEYINRHNPRRAGGSRDLSRTAIGLGLGKSG